MKKVIATFYLTILKFFHRIVRYKLTIASYKVRITIYKVRIARYKLAILAERLCSQNCEFISQLLGELISHNSEIKSRNNLFYFLISGGNELPYYYLMH